MQTLSLPQLGKSPKKATVRRWLVAPGQQLKPTDPLAEVETDEALFVVQCTGDAVLMRVLAQPGSTVCVGTPLAEIADSGGQPASISEAPVPQATAAAGAVIPILMPQAGQSMEEGTILKWRVQPGAQIKKGDIVFEVETDKAVVEVEAVDTGRLARIVVPEGGTIGVKNPVAYLADHDRDVDVWLKSLSKPSPVAPSPKALRIADAGEQPARHGAAPPARAQCSCDRIKASPAARRIAQERGLNLELLETGSGPGGRILSTDVLNLRSELSPCSAATRQDGSVRIKITRMRKAIAANLQASKQTVPHFYVRLTMDAAPMVAFYREQKAKHPCSINDVITAACARVIRELPQFRSRIEGDELVEMSAVNVGIAVSLPDGLSVPVLLRADRMSLKEIAENTRRIVEAARIGRLEGAGQGVFTITNLGMFGVEEFSAIINPHEAAILAVGAARESVIVTDGEIKAGRVITMTLSCDHRIIDGALAAAFLSRLKQILASPEKLIEASTQV